VAFVLNPALATRYHCMKLLYLVNGDDNLFFVLHKKYSIMYGIKHLTAYNNCPLNPKQKS